MHHPSYAFFIFHSSWFYLVSFRFVPLICKEKRLSDLSSHPKSSQVPSPARWYQGDFCHGGSRSYVLKWKLGMLLIAGNVVKDLCCNHLQIPLINLECLALTSIWLLCHERVVQSPEKTADEKKYISFVLTTKKPQCFQNFRKLLQRWAPNICLTLMLGIGSSGLWGISLHLWHAAQSVYHGVPHITTVQSQHRLPRDSTACSSWG